MMNWSEIPPNHFWQQSLLTRKPESTGSSWKALTVRVWTLWKLEKEGRFAFSLRSSTRTRSVSYKDDCQAMFQPMANKQTWEHFVSSDGGELQGCEAGSLKPYEKYLAEFAWALCLNDAEDLFSLARLGTPTAGLTTQLFVLHAGFLFWLDRIELTMDRFMNTAPGHASRDVKSENLPHCPPCAFEVFEGTACWEGWCGRGHQKEDYEHWWLLYIDILRVRECPCTKRGVQTTSMIPPCLRE